jgi:hypothetical protein
LILKPEDPDLAFGWVMQSRAEASQRFEGPAGLT